MPNLPLKIQQYSGPLALCLICLLLFAAEPLSIRWLVFDRDLVQTGELWRLVTGNLVHFNSTHLAMNLAGVIVLWLLHGDYYRLPGFLVSLFIFSLCCTLGILFFSPQLTWYFGLSGALHGLFVWGAYRDILRGWPSGWLLLAGLVVKLAWEQWQGPSDSMASLIDSPVAIEAHLFGVVGGLIIIAFELLNRWRRNASI